MKKIIVAFTMMFLIVALGVPAMAGSFADVPSNHWAYEAVNELVATGLISGYSDGTFKGKNGLTRYEIAVVLSRLLNNIDEAQSQLVDQVDFMITDAVLEAESGLSEAEAQDVQAILQAVIDKNAKYEAKYEPEDVTSENDSLSKEEAEAVAIQISALTQEYKDELADLGVEVASLSDDITALKEDIPKDNVEFSGSVDTCYQVGDYGDDPAATAEVLADGDALDLDLPTATDDGDYDDFPAEKSFYQKINLNANANLNNINFALAVDTINNTFTKTESFQYNSSNVLLGDQGDDNDFTMDNALLTIDKNDYLLKLGDVDGFDVASYFLDDEDMEGAEFSGPFAGFDLRAFVVGEDFDNDNEYYGVDVTKDFGNTKVTGKVYYGESSVEEVSDFAVAVDSDISDVLNVNGEAVYNNVKEADTTDSLFNINASYILSEPLTLRAGFEMVGEDFNSGWTVLADLEEDNNYDKYTVGADYVLNEDNTVKFDYTSVAYDPVDENKNSYKVSLDNIMGAFNNTISVELTENDDYLSTDDDVTVLSLGTEYTMSDLTTISANIVNKSSDIFDNGSDLSYNYLTAGVDHKLSDTINWITDLQYISGDYKDVLDTDRDAEGSFLATQLSVSF